MNEPKASLWFSQRVLLPALLSALAVIGAMVLVTPPSSNAPLDQAPLPIEREMAVTGEVVMIEGNVQIVGNPSSGKNDAYVIMDHLYISQNNNRGDKAIEFHVNENTRMDEDVAVGDKVAVLASANGDALSIKKTEQQQSGNN